MGCGQELALGLGHSLKPASGSTCCCRWGKCCSMPWFSVWKECCLFVSLWLACTWQGSSETARVWSAEIQARHRLYQMVQCKQLRSLRTRWKPTKLCCLGERQRTVNLSFLTYRMGVGTAFWPGSGQTGGRTRKPSVSSNYLWSVTCDLTAVTQ